MTVLRVRRNACVVALCGCYSLFTAAAISRTAFIWSGVMGVLQFVRFRSFFWGGLFQRQTKSEGDVVMFSVCRRVGVLRWWHVLARGSAAAATALAP